MKYTSHKHTKPSSSRNVELAGVTKSRAGAKARSSSVKSSAKLSHATAATTTISSSFSSSSSSSMPQRGRPRASSSAPLPKHICPEPACRRQFDRRYNLKVHMRLHDGIMPFDCSVCDRKFRWRASLRHHLRAHLRVEEAALGVLDHPENLYPHHGKWSAIAAAAASPPPAVAVPIAPAPAPASTSASASASANASTAPGALPTAEVVTVTSPPQTPHAPLMSEASFEASLQQSLEMHITLDAERQAGREQPVSSHTFNQNLEELQRWYAGGVLRTIPGARVVRLPTDDEREISLWMDPPAAEAPDCAIPLMTSPQDTHKAPPPFGAAVEIAPHWTDMMGLDLPSTPIPNPIATSPLSTGVRGGGGDRYQNDRYQNNKNGGGGGGFGRPDDQMTTMTMMMTTTGPRDATWKQGQKGFGSERACFSNVSWTSELSLSSPAASPVRKSETALNELLAGAAFETEALEDGILRAVVEEDWSLFGGGVCGGDGYEEDYNLSSSATTVAQNDYVIWHGRCE